MIPSRQRYAIIYDNPHTGEERIEMRNIPGGTGDWDRALEALKGQGCNVRWGGFMQDLSTWGRVASR